MTQKYWAGDPLYSHHAPSTLTRWNVSYLVFIHDVDMLISYFSKMSGRINPQISTNQHGKKPEDRIIYELVCNRKNFSFTDEQFKDTF